MDYELQNEILLGIKKILEEFRKTKNYLSREEFIRIENVIREVGKSYLKLMQGENENVDQRNEHGIFDNNEWRLEESLLEE